MQHTTNHKQKQITAFFFDKESEIKKNNKAKDIFENFNGIPSIKVIRLDSVSNNPSIIIKHAITTITPQYFNPR